MYDAIDVENMIILHLSALIPQLMKRQIVRTDPASLQMISQDYGPVDSERDYLNL